jgi:hypothetical protein
VTTISPSGTFSSRIDFRANLEETTAVKSSSAGVSSNHLSWMPNDGLDLPSSGALFKVEDNSTTKPSDGETKPTGDEDKNRPPAPDTAVSTTPTEAGFWSWAGKKGVGMAASWLFGRLYDKYVKPKLQEVGEMVVEAGENTGRGAGNPNAPRPSFVPF